MTNPYAAELGELKQEVEREEKFKPIHISELMSKEFPPAKWLIKDLVPVGGLIALSGPPASFKTWLTLEMALTIGGLRPFLETFETEHRSILIIDEENHPRLLQDRLNQLGCSQSARIYYLSQANFRLDNKTVKLVIGYCQKFDIGLVVIDSLVRIHGADENSATEMAKVFALLKEITKQDIAVLFTHHHRKGSTFSHPNAAQDMRGSSDILAAVDVHLAIAKPEANLLVVTQTKNRLGPELKPFNVTCRIDGFGMHFDYAGEVEEVVVKKEAAKEAIRVLLRNSTGPVSQQDTIAAVRSGTKVGERNIRDALKDMETDGEVSVVNVGRGKKLYILTAPEDELGNLATGI